MLARTSGSGGNDMQMIVKYMRIARSIASHWFFWWRERHAIREVRRNYAAVLQRIRKIGNVGRKKRVLFLFTESSKWKCQALYDAMAGSDEFDPVVALTRGDMDASLPLDEFAMRMEKSREFCRSRNMRYVEAYSPVRGEPVDLSKFSPDVVFYPLPWYLPESQMPKIVSKFALTCYVPYYIVCHAAARQDSQTELHRYLFRYYTTNEYWAEYFNRSRYGFPIAGKFEGAGHPMLDVYASAELSFSKDDLVIYAPHWSVCGLGERYSTFISTGPILLEYAKKHPEVRWCFKPHPTLRKVLVEFAGWTVEAVDEYYANWGKIGVICEDGTYPGLFLKSRALITDCSSFLMEYSAVNRPIIQLVSGSSMYKVAKPCRRLFQSFYSAHDERQLSAMLKLVVEDFQDPHAESRMEAVKELGLWHVSSSGRIMEDLRRIWR